MKRLFCVGDAVLFIGKEYGTKRGVVIRVITDPKELANDGFPVKVRFDDGSTDEFALTGELLYGYKFVGIYHIDYATKEVLESLVAGIAGRKVLLKHKCKRFREEF